MALYGMRLQARRLVGGRKECQGAGNGNGSAAILEYAPIGRTGRHNAGSKATGARA